jgi:hypothetical protein
VTRFKRPARRDVPIEWEEQLAELSSPTDKFTHLKLLWEPGYPWEHVERFMIYQMIPRHGMNSPLQLAVLEQLEHPLPPSKMGNYYDTVLGRFVSNPDCLITERAYWLYRETGCWGRPYWVIQGTQGGHKRWFSPVEQKFLKLAGLPSDPPAPGDLPYAPFDERVMAKLTAQDMMKGTHSGLRFRKAKLGGVYDARYEDDETRFREELVAWLKTQVDEMDGERVTNSLMKLDAPRSKLDPRVIEERAEQAEENFIKTGRTHGGLKLITQ